MPRAPDPSAAPWWRVGPTGATRDLWLHPTGPGDPEYGVWRSPSGLEVWRALDRGGPPAVDVAVWWVQQAGHYGTRRTDFIWTTNGSGLKILSHRMVDVLRQCGARLYAFDLDIRLRSGLLDGYVGVLEPRWVAGPVHSLYRHRRTHDLIVSPAVLAGMLEAGLTGLEIEPEAQAFPGAGLDEDDSPAVDGQLDRDDWLGVEYDLDVENRPSDD